MHLIAVLAAAIIIPSAQPFELRGRNGASSVAEPPNPAVFEPAMDLHDFASIDPKQFEWINPDEIKPGETTCGFLTAPFGWSVDGLDVVYPDVKVCKQSMHYFFLLSL